METGNATGTSDGRSRQRHREGRRRFGYRRRSAAGI